MQIECATIPAGIFGGIAAEHPSLWHPPSQCHVTLVQHALPPLTVPGVHSLEPVCVPSVVGPMFLTHCSVYFYFIFFNCCILFIAPPMTHVATHAFSFPPIFPAHSHLTCPSPHRYISHHALYFITTDEDPRLGRNVW